MRNITMISPAFCADKTINITNAKKALETIKESNPDNVRLQLDFQEFDTVEFKFPYKKLNPKAQGVVEKLIGLLGEIGESDSHKEQAKLLKAFFKKIPEVHIK